MDWRHIVLRGGRQIVMIYRILLLLIAVCVSVRVAELSPKDILAKNSGAVVQICVNGDFHGTGFIISKDGLIATANHVITTKESDYAEVFEKIEVRIPNSPRLHLPGQPFQLLRPPKSMTLPF
jgi:S1-C subfamily serine protease